MTLLSLTKLFLPAMLLCAVVAAGQSSDTSIGKRQKKKVERPAERNIIWVTPTKAKKINGLALGSLPSSMLYNNDSLHINGVHIEANPVMLYFIPFVFFGSLTSPFIKGDSSRFIINNFPDSSRYESDNTINGLNISIAGSGEMSKYNGISISTVATFGQSLKGISITMGQNNFYRFKGLLIAGLLNNVNKGTGLQIALFNRCKECKGVQLGLLNKIGKRTLPFINVQL